MKVYGFTFGVDGFGADEAPAFEERVYINRKKAFAHLMELNKDNFKGWKEESCYKKNLEQFCKEYCIEQGPLLNFYSMYEIEVKE